MRERGPCFEFPDLSFEGGAATLREATEGVVSMRGEVGRGSLTTILDFCSGPSGERFGADAADATAEAPLIVVRALGGARGWTAVEDGTKV